MLGRILPAHPRDQVPNTLATMASGAVSHVSGTAGPVRSLLYYQRTALGKVLEILSPVRKEMWIIN